MSSKYRDRLLQSSGVSNIRFESEYSKKLMTQMGWKEGNGLGKNQHGEYDCVQVKRREENAGLGKKALGGPTNWKDEWWNEAYNNSIKKLNVMPEKFKQKQKKLQESSSDDDSSDDSSCSSSDSGMPSLFANKHKHIKKDAKNAKKDKKDTKKHQK
jgi:Pin2-interacting protein X1